jgi:hypothetical protein
MKCKKLVIESDGTSKNTKVFADGKQIGLLQRFEFSADVAEPFVKVGIIQAVLENGKVKTHSAKVRDDKTQKFVDSQKVVTDSVLIEFEGS